MRTLFVVMPVFNEPDTLAVSVGRVRAACVGDDWRTQVILIDDGSAESTLAAVRALGASGDAIALFHPRNRGKGAAIRTGFAHALTLARDDDAIIIQDADLEYDPADFAGLLAPVARGEADIVLGNRWAVPPRGFKRLAHRMLNGFLTVSSNAMTGLKVSDMECCLKLFTIPAMRTIIGELDEERFGIEPQIVAAAARHGLRVGEAPASYAPRSFDEGKKIRMKDGLRVFVVLWRERRKTARAMHSRASELAPTTEPTQPARPSRVRLALQVVGFLIGCALVAWCIQRGFAKGSDGLDKLRAADPMLVLALLGATLGSIICSGFTFWTVARPIRRFSVIEMQAVNLMASLFNYAPVRLGLFLRCVFHWRVERMPALDIGAWIAGVAIVTLGSIGSALAAGLIQIPAGRRELALDWMWFATYAACIVAGSALTLAIGRAPLLRRYLKGAERVLTSPRVLGESLAFRTVDLSMWSLRMWAASRIVGVSLSPAQAAMLAAVAILGAGNPLGRIGWREALVALVAPYVVTGAKSKDELDTLTSQLALLESAGEAAITIPLGFFGAIWCWRAMRGATASVRSPIPTP